MHIDYDALCEQKAELESKRQSRKADLQFDAIELMKEFNTSLALPGSETLDVDGRRIQFTNISIKNNAGMYEVRPPHGLQPTADHQMLFNIAVMINPSVPGGEWIYIPIEMWYEKGQLIVVSGHERAYLRLHADKSSGRFFEAAAMIKKSCIAALSDSRLD